MLKFPKFAKKHPEFEGVFVCSVSTQWQYSLWIKPGCHTTDASASTSTSPRIFFSVFLSPTLMFAFALQEVKMKYCSGIRRAPSYLPHVVSCTRPVETLDPDCPAQKTAEGSDDFVYVCPCVEFRFQLGQTYSACVYVGSCPSACACACIASENQALVHYLWKITVSIFISIVN